MHVFLFINFPCWIKSYTFFFTCVFLLMFRVCSSLWMSVCPNALFGCSLVEAFPVRVCGPCFYTPANIGISLSLCFMHTCTSAVHDSRLKNKDCPRFISNTQYWILMKLTGSIIMEKISCSTWLIDSFCVCEREGWVPVSDVQ